MTERLVKQVSEDLVKVVIDYAETPKKKRSELDTGGFVLIHKAKKYGNAPVHSCGLNLMCEGKKIKI